MIYMYVTRLRKSKNTKLSSSLAHRFPQCVKNYIITDVEETFQTDANAEQISWITLLKFCLDGSVIMENLKSYFLYIIMNQKA